MTVAGPAANVKPAFVEAASEIPTRAEEATATPAIIKLSGLILGNVAFMEWPSSLAGDGIV